MNRETGASRRYPSAVGQPERRVRFVLAGAMCLVSLLGAGAQASAQPVSFSAATRFPTDTGPGSVAVGGDSDPDLAVVNPSSGNVSILLGAAGGGFTGSTDIAAPGARTVAVGHFDGDSDLDLAVATSAGVSILLGADGAGFTGPTDF